MNKWYDKRKTGKDKWKKDAIAAATQSDPITPFSLPSEPLSPTWELKLFEVQTFAGKGITSGSDGGQRRDQHADAVLGIMEELGQLAKDMRGAQTPEMKTSLIRKRLGGILLHCGELAILNGTTLDASMTEKMNDLCLADKKYELPASLM
jgi:hypothetical protein